jgi:hypothetical protein
LSDKPEGTGIASQTDPQALLDKLARLNQNPAAFATANRIMAVIALIAGVVFLSADVWWLHRFHLDELVFSHATAQGQIVENTRDYRRRNGRDYFRGYRARVRFQAEGGRNVVVSDWYGRRPPAFAIGQTVTVFYDRDIPENALIDHGLKNYLALGGPLLMGFLMLLGGVQRLLRSAQPPVQPGPPPVA